MFCNNLCSWFSKNIVFSLSAREIISPIMLSLQINLLPSDFSFLFITFLCFEPESIQCWLPLFSPDQEQAIQMEPLNAEVDEWEVAVNRVLLQDVIGRGAFGAVWRALLSSPNGQPGNRTVAAKCFTRKPPSIWSIIHMLISGVVTKMFHLGREGEGRGGPKLLLDQHTPPSSSLKVTRGKKKGGKGANKQRR